MKLNTTVNSLAQLIAVCLCMASVNVYAQDSATDATTSNELSGQDNLTISEEPALDTTLTDEPQPVETVAEEADPNAGFVDSIEASDSQIPTIGAGLKLGSLGFGIDIAAKISPKLNVRLSLNKLDFDFDDVSVSDETDLEESTDGSLAMSNHGLMLDYHPFAGTFRLSVGLYSSSNKGNSLTTGFIENKKIGDFRYDIDGEVVASGKMSGTLPYVGLGWGNTPRDGFPLSLSFDFGFLLGSDLSVTAEATGTATELSTNTSFDISDTSNPAAEEFQTQLQNEIDDANSDLSDVTVFPVISFGLNYRFN